MVKMAFKYISSKENPYFKELIKLKKGYSANSLFLVEGEDIVFEAYKNSCLKEIICVEENDVTKQFNNIKTTYISKNLYKEISSFQSLNQKIIGICKKEYSNNLGKRCIYLDNLQDPGNVGTIIRSSLAFNFSSLVLSLNSVSLYNSKVIQASKGAIFHLPIIHNDLLSICRGYNIYLTCIDGKDIKEVDKLIEPFILVFGNEGKGIKKEYLDLGEKLKINMSNFDSLNVASAAAIFLYKYSQN